MKNQVCEGLLYRRPNLEKEPATVEIDDDITEEPFIGQIS